MGNNTGHSQSSRTRSFSDCPFTLQLPKISAEDELNLDTVLSRARRSVRASANEDAIVLARLEMRDKLGRNHSLEVSNAVLTPGEYRTHLLIPLGLARNQILLRDLSLVVTILTNRTKYQLRYLYQDQREVCLQVIEIAGTTAEDNRLYRKLLREAQETPRNRTPSDDEALSLQEDSPSAADRNTEISFDRNDETEDFGNALIPTLDQYSNAVFREMYYLRENGGRQYKATNGQFIDESAGYYCYQFDLDSELHIADDAPIRLTLSGEVIEGAVMVCEGFQILIVVTKDLGSRVPSAMISAEPWQLLQKLGSRLRKIDENSPLALKLAEEGPTLQTNETGEAIPKGQQAAYDHVDRNEITVIWGPPGTGKTYVMSQIAMRAMRRGERVLIVSHSNTSVDGVIKATAERFRENGLEDHLGRGEVMRYGYVRDAELTEDPDIVAFNYALNRMPAEKRRMEELKKEKTKLQGQSYSWRRREIEAELKKVRMNVRTTEKETARHARILATTISKVLVDSIFEDNKYDLVMFDEISMAYVPQLVVAASYATKRFVCVGDFRQLAPIAQSESRRTLGTDVFSYLGINRNGRIYAHPWLVMLNEQRRMHPAISAFSNTYVYQRLLVDHESVIYGRDDIASKAPVPGAAMQLIDLNGTFCAAARNLDNSRFNILSAILSLGTALQAQHDGASSVGIITPYAAQARLITAMLLDLPKQDGHGISCATVHQFQGSERDVIVFDAVESYPAAKAGVLLSNNENSQVTRLINVAVTRARGKFVTIANSRFWERRFDEKQNIYCQLLKYLQNKRLSTAVGKEHALQKYIDSLAYGNNVRRYMDATQAIEQLRKDIGQAQDRLIVSLPDGGREAGSPVIELLREARVRGIRVMCKARDYQALPEDWKNISYASENAVFPLIVIDESAVWYGLPEFKGQFKDKDWTFAAVCPLIYRMQGKRTISMICSLTDIEYREWKDARSLLEEKVPARMLARMKTAVTDDEDQPIGLAGFVTRNIRCRICNKPTALKKGYKSGKIYLKCPACGNMDYLSKDAVNEYIQENGITCPQHHCEIRAGLGRYGLYVRCEAGHFLKADEI